MSALGNELKRPGDELINYGSGEFAAVLPDTQKDGATVVAERMRAAVEQLRIPHKGSPTGRWLTLSFGIAETMPKRNTSSSDLINAADQALKYSGNIPE